MAEVSNDVRQRFLEQPVGEREVEGELRALIECLVSEGGVCTKLEQQIKPSFDDFPEQTGAAVGLPKGATESLELRLLCRWRFKDLLAGAMGTCQEDPWVSALVNVQRPVERASESRYDLFDLGLFLFKYHDVAGWARAVVEWCEHCPCLCLTGSLLRAFTHSLPYCVSAASAYSVSALRPLTVL